MTERSDREDCFICGDGHPDVLEQHHIVPRRFGGADGPPNLVDLCPTCHRALERLYDQRFYDELGVTSTSFEDGEGHECDFPECTSTETLVVEDPQSEIYVAACDAHLVCSVRTCSTTTVSAVPRAAGGAQLRCEQHMQCEYGDCGSLRTAVYSYGLGVRVLCPDHARKVSLQEGEEVVER